METSFGHLYSVAPQKKCLVHLVAGEAGVQDQGTGVSVESCSSDKSKNGEISNWRICPATLFLIVTSGMVVMALPSINVGTLWIFSFCISVPTLLCGVGLTPVPSGNTCRLVIK